MHQIPPILQLQEADVRKMIACQVHLGSQNLDPAMKRYVFKRNPESNNHIIDLRKTWEKLQLAARVLVAIENPKDICAVALSGRGASPIAQRAVLKLSTHIGCRAIAGKITPGTFTNQQQSHYFEPRILVASCPRKDHQPIVEASYVNMPVIAFCDTNSNLKGVDIAIPCNTDGTKSVALMYWLLAREVLRLRGTVPRDREWDVMVDMFVYRDTEESEKATVADETYPTTFTQGGAQGWDSAPPGETTEGTGQHWQGDDWAGEGADVGDDAPPGTGDWADETAGEFGDEGPHTGNWGDDTWN